MITKRLLELRERAGISQSEIAKRLGIARTTYASYEQGAREPDLEMLKKLSGFYEVTVDYLLGNEKRIISEEKKSEGMEIYNRLPKEEKKFVDDMIKKLYDKRT